jgi:hypothetical protein
LEERLRRALILTTAVVATLILSLAAQAADFDPNEIVFPVQGPNYYTDTFDDCRGGSDCPRRHEATDIMTYGVKGVPVVAAADGVVKWIGTTCCYLAIDHGGGWATWYIHLNNDTPGTDDGLGWGIADGIEVGTPVSAGQLIGWVGDSGNAESTDPHLHFEIWEGDHRINPYPYLLIADGALSDQFTDDDESVHEADIEKIFAAGITKGCNPPTNDHYCPDQSVTRGQMAAFIRRWLALPGSSSDYYSDDDDNIFEGDINALTEAGIAFGCGPDSYCPDAPLLREEFAEMFTRAFGYTNPDGTDWFIDDDDSRFEAAINALKAADVTKGCNPPDNTRFCPYSPVSRAQLASFFVRALDL